MKIPRKPVRRYRYGIATMWQTNGQAPRTVDVRFYTAGDAWQSLARMLAFGRRVEWVPADASGREVGPFAARMLFVDGKHVGTVTLLVES